MTAAPPSVTPKVEFRKVSFEIAGKPILSDVSFSVRPGETLVLLGRSGSGKSTALKLTNGMLFPTRGQVFIDGRATTEWNSVRLKRSTGYVIQDAGLFPHFTVAQNVGLVPRLEGWNAADITKRVDHLLDVIGLPPAEFRARYPRQLSGGQRQRVGVARALAADPPLLLLDEPFGALDPVTRFELQRHFQQLQHEFHKTAIFVTHDIREALRLATSVVLLANGHVDAATEAAAFQNANTEEARAFLASL